MSEEIEREPTEPADSADHSDDADEGVEQADPAFGRTADATSKVPSLRKNKLLRRDARRHQLKQAAEEE